MVASGSHLAARGKRARFREALQDAGFGAARRLHKGSAMTDLTTLGADELENVKGGIDFGSIVGKVTGLIDKFTGGKYDVSGKAGAIMNVVSAFKGGGGGGTQQA
jgi:hypothetical protein